MSISYNTTANGFDTVAGMKSLVAQLTYRSGALGALVVLLSLASLTRAADPSASKAETSNPLEPLAFLTAHEWDAVLPDSPDGKKMKIHARFTWSENRKAVRISNYFVVDGKPKPYIDGLYTWNPEKKELMFIYVGAEGDLSQGTVHLEEGKLVHEMQMVHVDGKSDQIIAQVTPHGTESWDNAIFARNGATLTPVAQVKYLPAE
ncbi:MAG: hypothetical protein ACJ8KX_12550 [Chthoniobacterales bacterium]